jgi:diguanylate cyclase (GGDEF)-like protein
MTMRMQCIINPELGHFLARGTPGALPSYDLDLSAIFCDILSRANDFVPSEAGAIFLDDPVVEEGKNTTELALIACFGDLPDGLVGLRIPPERGIVATVYRTGRAYISPNVRDDPLFMEVFGETSRVRPQSVICAPLVLEGRVIGALELVNHHEARGYNLRELNLLEIFAQTISASIANATDAQRAREMAKRDDLTGLYNDRYLHYSLSTEVERALEGEGECGLIFLDLDHFKNINDVHGHLVGSRVLHEVGVLLRRILPGQAIAARYGGDEYVVVLPGGGHQEAYWVAEAVRQTIEHTVFLEQADPADPVNYPALAITGQITCSVGIATLRADILPRLGPSPSTPAAKNELMRTADTCMYVAKDQGRNRTVAAWDRHREH